MSVGVWGFRTALVAMGALATVQAHAAPTYIALGDSITFGETDLQYVPSNGDRGYVALIADALASQNGGVRPNVVNLAIDGETAASFLNNANPRTPPVVGRTNVPLQLENTNYGGSTALSQSQVFANTVAAQTLAGNTISAITITLGFNELAALAPATNNPVAEAAAISQIGTTLSTYQANETAVLTQVRNLAPNAALYLLGYYNPFPVDPNSPAAPVFNAGGTALNTVIQGLAAQFGATFVNTAPSFVGHEAEYTYQAVLPAGSSVGGPYGGVLPIGNVHPNAQGYSVIAADFGFPAATSVPEPAPWAAVLPGLAVLGMALRRRRQRQPAA